MTDKYVIILERKVLVVVNSFALLWLHTCSSHVVYVNACVHLDIYLLLNSCFTFEVLFSSVLLLQVSK